MYGELMSIYANCLPNFNVNQSFILPLGDSRCSLSICILALACVGRKLQTLERPQRLGADLYSSFS